MFADLRDPIRRAGFVLAVFATALGAQPRGAPIPRIDAHVHVFRSDPAYFRMLERLDLHVLNICVVDKHDRGFEDAATQHGIALKVTRESRGRVAWCSTFDPTDFEKPGFSERSIAQLEKTFRDGAIAVKIYKSMGMELKSSSGSYVMPDDPAFSPVLDAIARHGITLFAHLAEPSAAWRPLDPASPHYGYYKENPDWHMFLHPERPSKEIILAARDRMLAAHPHLRTVGCHLGSQEEDVDDIARTLDRYPNFAVDTAARMSDLMRQPREKVRRFLIRYQDRVVYGTDLSFMPWDDPEKTAAHMASVYARDWKYFATGARLTDGGRQVRGLALPQTVLRKLYRENAERWVPGLKTARVADIKGGGR